MAKFKKFAKYDTPENLVIKTQWRETGHAIGWVITGGALKKSTIIPDGDEHGVLWGLVNYKIDDEESGDALHSRACLHSPFCELAGIEDPDGMMGDIESAIETLRHYPEPMGLCGQLIETFLLSPRRSALTRRTCASDPWPLPRPSGPTQSPRTICLACCCRLTLAATTTIKTEASTAPGDRPCRPCAQ